MMPITSLPALIPTCTTLKAKYEKRLEDLMRDIVCLNRNIFIMRASSMSMTKDMTIRLAPQIFDARIKDIRKLAEYSISLYEEYQKDTAENLRACRRIGVRRITLSDPWGFATCASPACPICKVATTVWQRIEWIQRELRRISDEIYFVEAQVDCLAVRLRQCILELNSIHNLRFKFDNSVDPRLTDLRGRIKISCDQYRNTVYRKSLAITRLKSINRQELGEMLRVYERMRTSLAEAVATVAPDPVATVNIMG